MTNSADPPALVGQSLARDERSRTPRDAFGNHRKYHNQSGWLKSAHENKAKLQWESDKISNLFLLLERILLGRKTINVSIARIKVVTSRNGNLVLSSVEPPEVPHLKLRLSKPSSLCCYSRPLIIPVNLGSCLYGNVAGGVCHGRGRADYQSSAGNAARNLHSITPRWNGRKGQERARMYPELHLRVCYATILKKNLYCVLAHIIGPACRKGHGWCS